MNSNKNTPIKALLFDFDGTIADTAPGIVKTMQEVFKSMGYPIPTAKAVRQTIGIPLHGSIKTLGGFSDEEATHGCEVYRQLFQQFEVPNIGLFPNVAATLEKLRAQGLRLAICTSRDTGSLNAILETRGIGSYFEAIVTGTDGLKPKPAPDLVLALLERMGLHADEAVVVGDTSFDIGMGNSAGCRTVAVTYGNHSREQLQEAKPTFTIDRFEELTNVLALTER